MANKTIYSWLNHKLEVRDTEKYGKGIFTNTGVKKDDVLAVFGGYVMRIEEEENLSKDCEDSGVQIMDDFVIASKDAEEDTDFFNHSCEPNAGFKGQIFLVAMMDIEKDCEVTFDYAMVLHPSKGAHSYKMKCFCGLDKCRGYITESDWENEILQKKYKGYFQYYLQDKINRVKK